MLSTCLRSWWSRANAVHVFEVITVIACMYYDIFILWILFNCRSRTEEQPPDRGDGGRRGEGGHGVAAQFSRPQWCEAQEGTSGDSCPQRHRMSVTVPVWLCCVIVMQCQYYVCNFAGWLHGDHVYDCICLPICYILVVYSYFSKTRAGGACLVQTYIKGRIGLIAVITKILCM